MDCILYTSWQKYYNALSSLNMITPSAGLIDNISNIDNFFLEFRNITFVMQKSLKNANQKNIYSKYLYIITTDDMGWFIDKRNEICKEFPFKLEKEILIFDYINHTKILVRDIIHDINQFTKNTTDIIAEELVSITANRKIESNISVELVFLENGVKIDIYKKILNGIDIMDNFINSISDEINCNCDLCFSLKKMINEILNQLQFKKITFHYDYYIPSKIVPQNITMASRTEIMLQEGKNIINPKEMRIPIEESPYSKIFTSPREFFNYFSCLHCNFYIAQKNNLMPTILILFFDRTFIQYSFASESRATIYREINDVAETIMSENVQCIFFISECYAHNNKDILSMDYAERSKIAEKEILMSSMISYRLDELNYIFDVKSLTDKDLFSVISGAKTEDFSKTSSFKPIYKSFIMKSKIPFNDTWLFNKYSSLFAL